MNKKYYKNIDLIRVISFIAIFLYHLGILKGGYLAVCIFFTLSGYLSISSAYKQDDFSAIKYYKNRLIKLYLPLVLVTFISIAVISLIPDINFFNLKSETTSVLFGYNNFWQLSANMDYFARHTSSPFMHFWYIAILLQFDLIFPYFYMLLKKIEEKIGKNIVTVIVILLTLISTFIFCKSGIKENMMVTYYNTFTRLFSILFGVLIGIIHKYYGSFIPKFVKNKNSIIYFYLIILILLFIFASSSSNLFIIFMIITTLITCRLLDYSIINTKKELSKFDKIIKSLSSVSYYVYLIQYPIIFIFESININIVLKDIIIFTITMLISYILYFSTNKKAKKYHIIKSVLFTIIMFITLFGAFKYITSKDYTKEMKDLEKQLEENEKLIAKNQEQYKQKLDQENLDWISKLEDLENGKEKIDGIVRNLSITGIGDSVMLGAVNNLYEKFPNGYFDAKVSRSTWKANDILKDLKNKNMLGEIIVIHLGTNGDCSKGCKEAIMETCGDRKVFWINTTNLENVNKNLTEFAKNYSNLYIIDWNSISKGHSEYFYADGIHLPGPGRKAYTDAIYNAIYNEYLNEYNEHKQQVINKHEEEQKNKITFYGNSILLNAFDDLQNEFSSAKFIIDKDFTYETLKDAIKKSIDENTMTYNIVLALDSSMDISEKKYKDLIELCKDYKVFILISNNKFKNLSNTQNVTLLDFSNIIKDNKDYLMKDNIHLTDKGNKALINFLSNNLK